MNNISKKIEATLLKSKKYIDTSLSNKYIDHRLIKESKMTEAKQISIQDMLSFLSTNKDLVNEFALHDAYTQAVSKKFRDEYDLYSSYDRFEIEAIKFKASSSWLTYDELVKEYKDFSAKSGISSEDQLVKQTFEYALRYAMFDSKQTIWNFDKTFLSTMFSFLYYIKTGDLPKKGMVGIGGTIEDEMKENTEWDYWNHRAFKNFKSKHLPGYDISLMKNGKLVVKGFSSKDIEKIRHVFTLYGRNY